MTTADVAKAITQATGVEIDKRDLTLNEPIRALGEFVATIELHPEVNATVNLEVVPSK